MRFNKLSRKKPAKDWMGPVGSILIFLILLLAALPSHAMTHDEATKACRVAVRTQMDARNLTFVYRDSVATGSGGRWLAVVPVKGRNAFGAEVTGRIVCRIRGGRVVEIAK